VNWNFSYILGDVIDSYFAYWYRRYGSLVCLFFLSVTFVYYAQTAEDIDTISFFCTRQPLFRQDRIWLTSVNPFFLKFRSKVTNPLSIWASETFDGKLLPSGYIYRNGHNGEPIGNHHRSLKWYRRWPYDLPSPKTGPQMHPEPTSRHVLPPG